MPARSDDFDDLDGGVPSARPGLPVEPVRLWTSVRRDWKWLVFALVIWGVLGIGIAFLVVRHAYRSEGVLLWEPQGGGSPDHRVLATQAASVKMPVTLAKVKQRLKLGYPINVLEKQVDVWYDMNTNLVTVQGGGGSAEDARKLTNTVIEVFLENQTEIARARANDAAKALSTDLEAARAQLSQARKAYDEFRAEHGITDIDAEVELAVKHASELRSLQQLAELDKKAADARATALAGLVKKQSAMIVHSASSSNNAAALAATKRTELQTAKARYSADHPTVRALEAELAALDIAAKSKTNVASSVTTGANPEYAALQNQLSTAQVDGITAEQRNQSFAQILEQAERRVSQLTVNQGKAHVMMAAIERHNERIQGLEVQYALAEDTVRTPPVEFRVLTPASLPEWPEKSKRRIIAAGMPIGGVLVALLALLIRPLRDGKIHTAREAAFWANMPVVCTSAWPRDRDAFFPLIDELSDDGNAARGFTLVLSASPHERVLAEELAYWLGGSSLGNDGRPMPRANANGNGHGAPDDSDPANPAPNPAIVATPGPSTTVGAPATIIDASGAAGGAGTVGSPAGSGGARPGTALAVVTPANASSPLAAYRKQQAAMTAMRAGAHAWVGDLEGPALRRAARAADRVLIVLTSGTEKFTSLANLRTRLGRDTGVALLLLGVKPELLNLPDRVGDVDRFWRQTAART
jgi:uncharacterized protein involved in exopolysaccharide biosynthesis